MADCECCESIEIHEDLLKIVNETMPDENELYDLAELFKVFGDSTRIRILYVLFEAEVCVCDLAQALNMTQSAISHQLRILKQNKLVKNRREGKSIFYSLADDHVRFISLDRLSPQGTDNCWFSEGFLHFIGILRKTWLSH